MVNAIASPSRTLSVFGDIQMVHLISGTIWVIYSTVLWTNGFRIERVEERSWTQPDINAAPGSSDPRNGL